MGRRRVRFAVSGTDRDGLANIADKLKQRIEHFEIEYEGRLLKITMTFGGAIYQASETIYECLARRTLLCTRVKPAVEIRLCSHSEYHLD